MDLPEDGVAVQTDLSVDGETSGLTDTEDNIGLNLSEDIDVSQNGNENDMRSDEELSNDHEGLDMCLSSTPNSCISTGIQVPSEIVVIAGEGQLSSNMVQLDHNAKIAMTAASDTDEPLAKHLRLEQDGPTYILALPGVEGLTAGVVELGQRALTSSLVSAELLNGENSVTSGDNINQAWFTSREDKTSLHSKGHLWKQGMWSKDEVEVLENNIALYCQKNNITDPATIIFEMTKDERKDFYRSIAKDLNRPLFSVYRRVIRMYDKKNHVGKYTPEDLEKLKDLRSLHGNDWQAIGNAMGRSASSIKDRCRLMKENCNQGKWLQPEERRLAEAVYELAHVLPGERVTSGLSWAAVADKVGTRSEKQCRTKWLNYLNWKEAGGTEWTRDDDITLICRVYALNVSDENMIDWCELAKGWTSVRSPQWLRGKWWSLKRLVSNANTLHFPDICEFLYQQYVQQTRLKETASKSCQTSTPENTLSALHSHAHPHLTALLRNPADSLSNPEEIEETIPVSSAVQDMNTSIATTLIENIHTSATAIPSMGMSSMLQTLEVLPQGIHLTPASPQTFFVAHPTQPIPLTASISPNQIIIQAVTETGMYIYKERGNSYTDNLHAGDNMAMQMSSPPQIIISATGTSAGLTPLAPGQLTTAPTAVSGMLTLNSNPIQPNGALPISTSAEFVGEAHDSLIEEEAFENQTIDDSEELDGCVDDLETEQIEEDKQTVSAHLILSDPMLPASNSPDLIVVDIQKSQSGDDCLESVSGNDN